MDNEKVSTKYAPAGRASVEKVQKQIELFQNNEVLNKFLGKIPAIFIIVNEYRQVVYMNKGALEFTRLEDLTSIIGSRPGEILGCVHSREEEGGCGTSESCTYCGAVNVVFSSQRGQPAAEDCRLTLGSDEESYDLRLWASPIVINDERFHVVTIQDIRHEKRRFILERIFFHDILNTITGLLSTIETFEDYYDKIDQKTYLKKLDYLVHQLKEEIESQRILSAAENKALSIRLGPFNSLDILNELVDTFKNYTISKEKTIILDSNIVSIEIISDRTILRRILYNMVKNSLEATQKGDLITIGCDISNSNIQFWVHNPGFIPRNVQLRIFQRSFSSKGTDRGLGTYSMKLLSSYLNGNVTFSTSEKEGTIFKITCPRVLENSSIH